MIAALYVDPKGTYADLPDVDLWDETRDARRYAGPWPVVAHPPCARWCQLAPVVASKLKYLGDKYAIGNDGGCFEAALAAVRGFGGILEHPAYSIAWYRYGLPVPGYGGWTTSFDDPGHATAVSQVAYGHRARKRTWLYAVGCELPAAGEVDHAELIAELAEYDGWALSTSAAALQSVIALCPPGVRIAAWYRSNSEPPGNRGSWWWTWEPVIVAPARPPAVATRDCFSHHKEQGFLGSTLPGQKPAAVCRWIFALLGAQPGDVLVDLFPGSGAVTWAWNAYAAQLSLAL